MSDTKVPQSEVSRRKFITGALGASAGIGVLSLASVIGTLRPINRITPDKQPPAEGDVLVKEDGSPLTAADIKEGGDPLKAWPKGNVVKNGEPNNLLFVFKYPQSAMGEGIKKEATSEGILVYSAICMHLGCQVNYQSKDGTLLCPCHSGQYDPKQGAKVIGGPPPKPLPQLPIKVEGNDIKVTGEYLSPRFGAEG